MIYTAEASEPGGSVIAKLIWYVRSSPEDQKVNGLSSQQCNHGFPRVSGFGLAGEPGVKPHDCQQNKVTSVKSGSWGCLLHFVHLDAESINPESAE
ncbi:unnamed protein product [Aspergillus oryzae]|uniref:Unnamed protein product n=2 Tax=Aspergillus oryzae TaxID=5062 RepID=A0AAN5BUJ6_ASPOZ|nr:unnamed protein product [Aspergillus oryzae]GMF90465.1 unnamed protein product [Aspergillus oryzae]GMG07507.1 unnamed protein product [Aspergillus oryzae]GMG25890.1 unnamed protein product [Aspergillus oryzae]GMG51014.1 unnamed protein product [Aspergillus oryzae var. brunneus]